MNQEASQTTRCAALVTVACTAAALALATGCSSITSVIDTIDTTLDMADRVRSVTDDPDTAINEAVQAAAAEAGVTPTLPMSRSTMTTADGKPVFNDANGIGFVRGDEGNWQVFVPSMMPDS